MSLTPPEPAPSQPPAPPSPTSAWTPGPAPEAPGAAWTTGAGAPAGPGDAGPQGYPYPGPQGYPSGPAYPPAPGYPGGAPWPGAAEPESDKSFVATWLLALLLGSLGVDRFYLGKVGTGIAKLLTVGGLGVWSLVDLVLVLTGVQRDRQGRRLAGYQRHRVTAWVVTGIWVVLSGVGGIVAGTLAASAAQEAVEQAAAQAADDLAQDLAAEQQAAEEAAQDALDDAEQPASADGAPVVDVMGWALEGYGTYVPVQQSGTGDASITLPDGVFYGAVQVTYDGPGDFRLSVVDVDGSEAELLVEITGPYAGTLPLGLTAATEPEALQVTAGGPWSLTISPVGQSAALPASGHGDGVFLYDGPGGDVALSHAGTSGFLVFEQAGEQYATALLADQVGAWSGTAPLSAGPSVVVVLADGDWTATLP
ncbi:TM2 domain-containing protein [Cellulomonas sp. P4]|uniref:TM2 domain-containing protein n=1 Tax=Cellulomonas sp. P4 TaxID=3142533 RepID=UPI0031BBC7FA